MKKIFSFLIISLFAFNLFSLDYTIPPNTYSIQSGDFDNDGDNDIVVGHINNETYLSILENNGNGEFVITDTMHSFGSIAVYKPCNLDNEAGMEIITNYQDGFEGTKQLKIFYNNDFSNPFYYDSNEFTPFGNFTPGDFDGDSDYDLVFSSLGAGLDNLWGVMYNLGDREFSEPDWFECPNQASNAGFYELECCDLDNNGFDDIIAYANLETYIYYSDGNSFELDSLNCYAPNGRMVSEDFDNDSDYDIIVTHWPGGSQSHFLIYENLENHQFLLHDVTYNDTWGQPISADLNGDELIDIVNVGNINGIKVFYNVGSMQFDGAIYKPVESYGENYYRSSFSDFDGNGTQDIAIIRYGIEENNLTILYNDGDGNFLEESQTGINNEELVINNYKLNNYPNPFNPTTTISFSVTQNSDFVNLEVFNIKGQKVKTFIVTLSGVEGSINWNGTDENNKPVSSGIYFYKLNVNGKTEVVKKCLLLK